MIRADVILPIAVGGTYTYLLPADCTVNPQIGMRVLVPLGPKKIHTGIIYRFHYDDDPQDGPSPSPSAAAPAAAASASSPGAFISSGASNAPAPSPAVAAPAAPLQYKEILCFLDSYPIVTPAQLQLWVWIADYYMCTLGEVMKAALPSALKLESETRIRILPDYQATERLSPLAQAILDCLADGKPKNLDEIAKKLQIRTAAAAVSALLEMGAVTAEEHVADPYVARSETRISLAPDFQTTKLSPKQQELLHTFFQLQDEAVLREGETANPSISRTLLLQRSGASPAILKALIDKHVLTAEKVAIDRLTAEAAATQPLPRLSEPQQQALDQIHTSMQTHLTTLLYGVTSSGKTEIYIRLIEEQLQKGNQVLMLVPEIALTTQLTDRLRRVLGNRLGVYHSKFSDRERVEIYRNVLLRKSYDVIIGVRSSLFLPFTRLGLIILDEEHDASYKQQDPAPRYHARSAAIMLANMTGAKVLLGTATPAVETYHNALSGKFGLVKLTTRYRGLSLPQIQIIDLKRQYHRKEMYGHLSDPLHDKIRDEIGRGKQVILFQNRRGYSSYIECKHCAYVPKCVNCDISLTEHKYSHQLVCHYCGYTIPIPSECPACHEPDALQDRGFGTEMIEDEMHTYFPLARTARMDLDTTRTKNGHQRIIEQFAAHQVDILIGTQMVTKGLHFDDVSLVSVLKADALLHQPDFRSTERAFQMLEQVAGRAGRKGDVGQVIIQTSDPEHPLFQHLVSHDYDTFFREQISERQLFHYPPFHRIIIIHLRHHDQTRLDTAARSLQELLAHQFTHRCSPIIIPAIARVQNQYYRQIMLKIEATANYRLAKQLLSSSIATVRSLAACKGTTIFCDVDPQ